MTNIKRVIDPKTGRKSIAITLPEPSVYDMFQDDKSWYNPDAVPCMSLESYEQICDAKGKCKTEVKDQITFEPFRLLKSGDFIECGMGTEIDYMNDQYYKDQEEYRKRIGV